MGSSVRWMYRWIHQIQKLLLLLLLGHFKKPWRCRSYLALSSRWNSSYRLTSPLQQVLQLPLRLELEGSILKAAALMDTENPHTLVEQGFQWTNQLHPRSTLKEGVSRHHIQLDLLLQRPRYRRTTTSTAKTRTNSQCPSRSAAVATVYGWSSTLSVTRYTSNVVTTNHPRGLSDCYCCLQCSCYCCCCWHVSSPNQTHFQRSCD